MEAAQTREFGVFEAGDGAEQADLLGMLQLGLEADDVPQRAGSVVLSKLDHRVRPAPGARIVEADGFHRAETQRLRAALGHHLDRHAAFEIRDVLPFLIFGLFARDQRGDEGVILRFVERTVDIVMAFAFIPARLEPGHVHVDRLAVDDRRDRVEEGERVLAGLARDGLGEHRRGERAGRDDRGAVGECIDAFANDRYVRVRFERSCNTGRETVAIHRERGARRHLVKIALAQDQRAQRAHFLVEQPDSVAVRIVRTEAVRADELGEIGGVVRRGGIGSAAHFGQAHFVPRLGQLPRRFRSGEAAADDMDIVVHGRGDNASNLPCQARGAT